MKLRLLLPIALTLIASNSFGANALSKATHHLSNDCKKLVKSFRHNLLKRDKRHLIGEARRLCASINHFKRRQHKRILGFTVGHKHSGHRHLKRDFRKVKIRMGHLNKTFRKKRRPHHVMGRMKHVIRWYKRVHALLHRHTG